MKKLVIFTLLSVALIGCTSENYGGSDLSNLPATRVFVQGHQVGVPQTKASSLVWPYVDPEGWETARFSIRADRTVPDYMDHPSAQYYGRKPGKPGNNRGKVYTDFPYGHYNDRDFDYYLADTPTGENIGLFRYVFDSKGVQTQLAIKEAPMVSAILQDVVDDLEAEIAAGKNVSKNNAKLADINSLLALGDDYLQSHILWYVVKEVGQQYRWHVNGSIVPDPVPTPTPHMVAPNVVVDIHQQKHADWAEIKTSVHIRTDAESVVLNIPLAFEDIVEQYGTTVRVYKDYLKDSEFDGLNITVTHDNDGITIAIEDIDADKIDELKEKYNDGLTVEVHSFCKNDDAARIWEAVKKSCVVTTGKPCTVVGQITSAYFENESYLVKVQDPPAAQ